MGLPDPGGAERPGGRFAEHPPHGRHHPLTLLSRLGDKGFVRSEKVGRSARYTPLVSQEDYLAGQSRRFLDQLCGGSLSTFANALCSSGLTRQELDELRDLLNGGKL